MAMKRKAASRTTKSKNSGTGGKRKLGTSKRTASSYGAKKSTSSRMMSNTKKNGAKTKSTAKRKKR